MSWAWLIETSVKKSRLKIGYRLSRHKGSVSPTPYNRTSKPRVRLWYFEQLISLNSGGNAKRLARDVSEANFDR